MSCRPQTILQGWRAPRLEIQQDLTLENMSDPSTMAGLMNSVRHFEPFMTWDVLPDGTIAYSDSTAYAIKLAAPEGQVTDVVAPVRSMRRWSPTAFVGP